MPLFKSLQTKNSQLLIWKVTESEDFFREKMTIKCNMNLAKRRLEYLSSRYLLKHMASDFPLENIKINPHGRPYIEAENIHFSLSHSFPYVAAALSKFVVGIDVQTYRGKIKRLQSKFLTNREQVLFEDDIKQITLAWSGKEAAFKWSDYANFNFRKHLPIRDYQIQNNNAEMIIDVKRQPPTTPVPLIGSMEDEFGWMMTLPPKEHLNNIIK